MASTSEANTGSTGFAGSLGRANLRPSLLALGSLTQRSTLELILGRIVTAIKLLIFDSAAILREMLLHFVTFVTVLQHVG